MDEIQEFKKLLGPAAMGYSHSQLRQLRREMYALAEPELIEKLGELVIQAAGERQASWKTKKVRREAEIARLNRQIQELIRMRTEGLITDQEFLAQRAILSERRFALEGTPVLRKNLVRVTPQPLQVDIHDVIRPRPISS